MSRWRTTAAPVFVKPERLRAPVFPRALAQATNLKIMSVISVAVDIDVSKAHVDVAVLGAKRDAQRFR